MSLLLQNVSKAYNGASGTIQALEDISLEVAEGEFVCLLGPSGCGKSTLLNLVGGFESASSGSLSLDGAPLAGPSLERVMMFQESALFPWLNAIQNVEFGLKSLGLGKTERTQRAARYLEMVSLGAFSKAQPHELSGGMKQRVALARALAVDPRLLLMDEPFAAVDAGTRELLHGELARIWRATNKTILFVTHNVSEAIALATRVLVFTARPGRIKAEFDLRHLPYPRRLAHPDTVAANLAIGDALREEVIRVETRSLKSTMDAWDETISDVTTQPDGEEFAAVGTGRSAP